MKRFLIIAIIAVVGATAMAQTQNKSKWNELVSEKALYVIDGKVCSRGDFEKLSSGEINNIKVFKGIEEVIVIDTKSGKGEAKEVIKIVGVKYVDPKSDKEVNWRDSTVEVQPVMVSKKVEKKDGMLKTTTTTIEGDTTTLKVVLRDKGNKAPANLKPVIIVQDREGNIKVVKDTKEVKIETVKSITVLKDSKAEQFKQYGDVTYGVVFVELK